MKARRKTKFPTSLAKIHTYTDLALLLGISGDELSYAIKHASHMYTRVPLKKKDGTPRSIRAPKDELKTVQRSILDVVLAKASLPTCAYGFSSGRGVIENAELHANDPYLFNIDIQDFFPSVHHTRVHKLFLRFGANSYIAQALTKLTVLAHALPQGAPSSPYIAALALDELDRRLTILCAKNRLTYSRYFDDIAISGGLRAHQVRDKVIEIISMCGYKAHTREDKLQLYGPGETHLITGIEIRDGKLSVPNTKDLAKYVADLKSHGMAMLRSDNPLKERLSLRGKIVFLKQVDLELGQRLEAEFNTIPW